MKIFVIEIRVLPWFTYNYNRSIIRASNLVAQPSRRIFSDMLLFSIHMQLIENCIFSERTISFVSIKKYFMILSYEYEIFIWRSKWTIRTDYFKKKLFTLTLRGERHGNNSNMDHFHWCLTTKNDEKSKLFLRCVLKLGFSTRIVF